VIAIEQSKKSIPYAKMKVEFPVALVVGNETIGVSKEVLKMADEIIELPMFGVNISLNVMVSLAIVLYKIIESSKITNG
jgi:tRNA G18 (ribose-2'-O)-methylase SpoU